MDFRWFLGMVALFLAHSAAAEDEQVIKRTFTGTCELEFLRPALPRFKTVQNRQKKGEEISCLDRSKAIQVERFPCLVFDIFFSIEDRLASLSPVNRQNLSYPLPSFNRYDVEGGDLYKRSGEIKIFQLPDESASSSRFPKYLYDREINQRTAEHYLDYYYKKRSTPFYASFHSFYDLHSGNPVHVANSLEDVSVKLSKWDRSAQGYNSYINATFHSHYFAPPVPISAPEFVQETDSSALTPMLPQAFEDNKIPKLPQDARSTALFAYLPTFDNDTYCVRNVTGQEDYDSCMIDQLRRYRTFQFSIVRINLEYSATESPIEVLGTVKFTRHKSVLLELKKNRDDSPRVKNSVTDKLDLEKITKYVSAILEKQTGIKNISDIFSIEEIAARNRAIQDSLRLQAQRPKSGKVDGDGKPPATP